MNLSAFPAPRSLPYQLRPGRPQPFSIIQTMQPPLMDQQPPTFQFARKSQLSQARSGIRAWLVCTGACLCGGSSLAIGPSESSSPRPGYDFPSQQAAADESPEAALTGDWNGARTSWEARGIKPYAVLAAEVFGNVDGGLKTGFSAPGVLDFGVDLDLEKLAGWTGGGFTATAFAAYGNGGTDNLTGAANPASGLFTNTHFNAFNIFLSQSLADERIYIKAGQLAADDDFMASDSANLLLNSAFGALPTASANMAAPSYPLAAPGVFIRVTPDEIFSVHGGIYAGDAGPVESGNHGFDWRTGGAAGWVSFAEADFTYGCGVAKLGGYYHSGEFENYRNGISVDGLGTIYGIVDHRFIESGAGRPGLAGFVRASFAPQDERATVSQYYDAGFAWSGIFKADDALALGVGHTIFGDDYIDANPGVTSAETTIELTYRMTVFDGWAVQPDLQYVMDPHFARNNALVLGMRTELSF